MDTRELKRLEKIEADARVEEVRLRTIYQQTLGTLKEDYGYANLAEAEAGLKAEEEELAKLEKQCDEALVAFKEEWKDEIAKLEARA